MPELLDRLLDASARVRPARFGESSPGNDIPVELTEEIRALLEEWSGLPEAERRQVTEGLQANVATSIRLLIFARRMAVLAVREKRAAFLHSGLLAVAAEDSSDYRDTLMVLCLLHHSAKRIRANVPAVLEGAARLAQPEMAEMIRRLPTYAAAGLRGNGYREAWGKDGFDYEDCEPSCLGCPVGVIFTMLIPIIKLSDLVNRLRRRD